MLIRFVCDNQKLVSRSTIDLHFLDFTNCTIRCRESLAVETNLLSIIQTEKIDSKVSRSTIDLDFPDFANCTTRSRESLLVGIKYLTPEPTNRRRRRGRRRTLRENSIFTGRECSRKSVI